MTVCQNVAEKTGMLTFKRSLLLVQYFGKFLGSVEI